MMDIIGRKIVGHDFTDPTEERITISLELDDGKTLHVRAGGAGEVCLLARLNGDTSLEDCLGETIAGYEAGEWSMTVELENHSRLELSACGREEVYLFIELV